MTARNPLVLVNGEVSELPSGDTITGASGGGSVEPTKNDFRLTLTSNTFTTTADVTGATRLYLTPPSSGGTGKIATYDSSTWTLHSSAQIYIDFPADARRIFDIYVYWTGSALALEAVAFDSSRVSGSITNATAAAPCVLTATNSLSVGDLIAVTGIVGTLGTDVRQGLNDKVCYVSARSSSTITLEGMDTSSLTYTSGGTWYKIPTTPSTAPVQQDGVWCKTGSLDRRWVGRIFTLADGTVSDSYYQAMLDNVDNAVSRPVSCSETASTWNLPAGTNTSRAVNISTGAGLTRIEFIQCFVSSKNFRDYATANGFSGGFNYESMLALTRVPTSYTPTISRAASSGNGGTSNANGAVSTINTEFIVNIPAGPGFLQRIETNGFSGANTFVWGNQSSGGSNGKQQGLVGTVSH